MKRYLGLFVQYLVQYCKVRLAYKADFFISVASTLVATIFGLALVFLLFRRAPEIAGWSFEEILFLYGFGLIPLALFNTISVNLYYFGQVYIVEGKFDRVLLRPVHSLFQVMSEQFRLESLSDALVGLVIVSYAGSKLGVSFGPMQWLLGAGAVLCGMIIYLGVFLILTCVSFWAEDRVGVIPPVYNMLTFGRYPLDIYNPLIRFLLSWIIPFGFAAFYPSAKLLGHSEYDHVFLALPLVAAVSVVLAILLWNRGVRNYSSTGS
ncbi:MAG: ABC-2 family transporter protein [Acidobacteria bacterium]|nr:ABC-2 family transporter protein [Acidobacteriota bacterium]